MWRKLLKKNLSQLKRQRQNEKIRLRNRGLRSQLRNHVRDAREAITSDIAADTTRTKVAVASRVIDKMVTKGLIHRNTAARSKSRLMHRYHSSLREAGVAIPSAPAVVEVPAVVEEQEESV